MAIQKFGDATQQMGELASTTNGVIAQDVRPTIANLNKTIESARKSMESLDATIGDARPGVQALTKKTIPEIGQLVQDLRIMSTSLASVAEKLELGIAPVVVLATAHPAKFPIAVKAATAIEPALPAWLSDLYERPERYDVLANDQGGVEAFIRAHSRAGRS